MTYDPDQLTMFGEDERIRLLRDDLIRGTQFQDGKLRVEEFVLKSNPDDAAFIEFLKKGIRHRRSLRTGSAYG